MAAPYNLSGQTALVTGGTRGIGRAIAFALARSGARVVVSSRKAPAVEATVGEIRAEGHAAEGVPANVGRLEEAHALADQCIARFERIDILVNNAATNPHNGRTIDVPASMLDKTYEVNVRGPMLWTQYAWNRWMSEHGGVVVNIASVGGYSTSKDIGVYCIFKSTLIHMTKQLGAELGPKVRVNCIAPGLIRTDFARVLWEGERGVAVANSMPMKTLGDPEDIGMAALFLASDDSKWITGQTLVVDGGELVRVDHPGD